jgi:hypothetical protein
MTIFRRKNNKQKQLASKHVVQSAEAGFPQVSGEIRDAIREDIKKLKRELAQGGYFTGFKPIIMHEKESIMRNCGCQNRHRCSYHEGHVDGYAQAEKDIANAIRTGRIVSNMQPATGDDCAHGVISYHDCTECIAEGIEHGEHRSSK